VQEAYIFSTEPYTSEMSTQPGDKPCLQALPEELLQYVVEHLDNYGLSGFSLAAKWCLELASSVRWREVALTDCSRTHASEDDSNGRRDAQIDDHDDTPLLRKLVVLATYVQRDQTSTTLLTAEQKSFTGKSSPDGDTSLPFSTAGYLQ
jgi:hypothetical protein